MNLMGKIFTLLIFFMSISFLVVAVMVGASHRNWKEAATQNKAAADFAQRNLEDAKSKSNEKQKQLDAERVARSQQLAQLESQLAIAVQRRDDKEKELTAVLIITQQQLSALNSAETRLKEQDAEVERLKGENTNLVDDIAAHSLKVVNLTNDIYKVRSEIESLEKMRNDMRDALTQKTKVMKALGIPDDALTAHIPRPLDGHVLTVRKNIIAVSLGTDDGLKEGHVLDIYRNQQFVGQAVVSALKANTAVATIAPEYLQRSVMKGDNVTTKF